MRGKKAKAIAKWAGILQANKRHFKRWVQRQYPNVEIRHIPVVASEYNWKVIHGTE